jgi:hypothetical protein
MLMMCSGFFLLNCHMVTDYTKWYMRSLTELVDFSLQRIFFVTNIILFLNSRGKNWTLLQYLNYWTFKQKHYNNMYQATCPVLDFKNSSPASISVVLARALALDECVEAGVVVADVPCGCRRLEWRTPCSPPSLQIGKQVKIHNWNR